MDQTQFRFQVIILVMTLSAAHDKVSWKWDPCLQIKSTYVSDISYMHRLEVVLYNILNNFVGETQVSQCRIFHLWCHSIVLFIYLFF